MALANDLVQGPEAIRISKEYGSREYAFECIFRVLTIKPNQRRESWSVFRREREWSITPEDDAACLLRHAIWDNAADETNRSWERGDGPTVSINTRYVDASRCDRLGAAFQTLDEIIVGGLALDVRLDIDHSQWQELSLFRSLDWGSLDTTWHVSRQNERCEAAVFTLSRIIEEILAEENDRSDTHVAIMKMIYPLTPYLPLA